METVTIYHNPRCSKSRETLRLLEARGIAPEVALYLETPPDAAGLDVLLRKLGKEPRELLRTSEAEYAQLGLGDPILSRDALIAAMVAHPILIERPIVVVGEKAALGRPPANVLTLLEPPLLETERLLLRALQAPDLPAIVALWTDPDVTRFLGGPRDPAKVTASLQEDIDAGSAPVYDLWPTIEKATGRLIGHCGLLDKEVEGRREIEVVYVLARDRWGAGLATEVASALVAYAHDVRGIGRVIALIEPENAASERVAQKAGLRFEREIVRPSGARRRLYARGAA